LIESNKLRAKPHDQREIRESRDWVVHCSMENFEVYWNLSPQV